MSWIKTVLREVWGLFVDDGRFALAIIVWLLIAWLVPRHLGIAPVWTGLLLFLGLAAILLESACRRATRAP
ncbi:hypothetical protein [Acidisoma silvae]|uniref:Uncharacterized protein n=1 Tax=Acidisoma silvae TaxID=2802396 RepID=A0A964DZA1_9PROT|nr:hypothetical protein [Acidisoma silvae]MCB8876061.1 hypothetical protein [Acidisoma silvae]